MSDLSRTDHPDGRPRPYSATASFAGTMWVCGQIPAASDGVVPDSIGAQVRLALDNLEGVLQAGGSSLDRLLKVTVYLADLDEFDAYNEAYLERLTAHPLPPRTTVEVARFRGAKRIEIDAVAAVDDSRR